VTIEDFVRALQDASGVDLSGFIAWYAQAGTPVLTVEDAYDPATRSYRLTLRQSTPATPGQAEKRPLPIPVAVGLISEAGAELAGTRMLLLEAAEQTFTFSDVDAPPVPSLLRGYSAPVKLVGLSRARLRLLATYDTDPFVRWDSGQQYATAVMLDMVAHGGPMALDEGLVAAMAAVLGKADDDPAFAAAALGLPREDYVGDQMAVVDVDRIYAIRRFLTEALGARLRPLLLATYERLADPGPYRNDGAAIGRRALRNACLGYLAAAGEVGLAKRQFDAGANMTDVLAALACLANTDTAARREALAWFHAKWRGDDLVLDKWFTTQAVSRLPGTLDEVRLLLRHADFDMRNPNRLRALVAAFATGNPVRFHDASGAGYRLLTDVLMELDPLNGQTASRMVNPLGAWRRQPAARAALMREQLERLLSLPQLSRLTYEKASLALAT
jgi:aminopeptidase N